MCISKYLKDIYFWMSKKFEVRILHVEYIIASTNSLIFYDGWSDLITSDKCIINFSDDR